MKNTDFANMLGKYLSVYLPAKRNLSSNTISSYCDTFKLFLSFIDTQTKISPYNIKFSDLTSDLVLKFLDWLETNRNCGISTRNQRLACFKSFLKYVMLNKPEMINYLNQILALPSKKVLTPNIKYLNAQEISLILNSVDVSCKKGRRNLTLLSTMYDTGARVQEICDLVVNSLRLDTPSHIKLIGKGNKARIVPLLPNTVSLLKRYIKENHLDFAHKSSHPLFFNSRKEKLTRAGIAYVLNKYVQLAKQSDDCLPKGITPHTLRHSKAMHLLEADVNIVYIRDILGHVDVSTTEVYAKANLAMKRKALETIAPVADVENITWTEDKNLLEWLTSFKDGFKIM